MKKRVLFSLRELVWETREYCADETDWQDIIEKAKKETEGNYDWYVSYEAAAFLETVKVNNISWADVIDMFDGKKEDILFDVKTKTMEYETSILTYVKEALRDTACDEQISYTDYADDYDEDVRVIETED